MTTGNFRANSLLAPKMNRAAIASATAPAAKAPMATGCTLTRLLTPHPPCRGLNRAPVDASASSGDRLAVQKSPHPGMRRIGQQGLGVSMGHHRLRLRVEEHRVVSDRLDAGQIVRDDHDRGAEP